MSLKCPSCGFESPESSKWCDFCKEPFRRKEAKAPEAPPAPAPGPKLTYSLPPTVAAKERAKPPAPAELPEPAKSDELPPEAHQRLTAALSVEQAAEKVPGVPKWVRWGAWAFLGIWFIAGMILTGVMLGRQKLQEAKPAQAPLPAPAPGPAVDPSP